MMALWKKIKGRVDALWDAKVASKLSTRTRKYIGILAIPGAVLKVAAVVAAGASLLHIMGPYMLGIAAVTTTSTVALIARDFVRNRLTVHWTNQAGQRICSSRLAREELRDIQKKLNRIDTPSKKHNAEARRLVSHFNRFASKVGVMEDVPSGNGAFRFMYQGKPLSS